MIHISPLQSFIVHFFPFPFYFSFFSVYSNMSKSSLPTYDQLPIDPKYPAKTAWGLWGTGDNLGTLNLLTAERVAEVYIDIKETIHFCMNTHQPLDLYYRPVNASKKAKSSHSTGNWRNLAPHSLEEPKPSIPFCLTQMNTQVTTTV